MQPNRTLGYLGASSYRKNSNYSVSRPRYCRSCSTVATSGTTAAGDVGGLVPDWLLRPLGYETKGSNGFGLVMFYNLQQAKQGLYSLLLVKIYNSSSSLTSHHYNLPVPSSPAHLSTPTVKFQTLLSVEQSLFQTWNFRHPLSMLTDC